MDFDFELSSVPNLSLQDLVYRKNLSVRATNVCKNNGLNSLHAILNHYRQHQTFLHLRNCGKNTEKELVELCLRYTKKGDIGKGDIGKGFGQTYKSQEGTGVQIIDISLQDLAQQQSLSKKALNVCRFNGLNYLHDILNHYNLHQGFRNLRSCGVKSEKELISLCQKTEREFVETCLESLGPDASYLVSSIPDAALHELAIREDLSNRTIKVCKNNGLHSHDDILNYYNIFHSFRELSGCGSKTEKELINLCQKTEHKLFEIYFNYLTRGEIFIREEDGLEPRRAGQSIFDHLTPFQEHLLNQFFQCRIQSLSKRARDWLKIAIENEELTDNLKAFHSVVSKPDFSIY